MIKSMTGYGKSTETTSCGVFTVEMTSVNKRFLECQVYLPSILASLEGKVRSFLSQNIQRGQVTVRIKWVQPDNQKTAVQIDENLFSQLKTGWQQVAQGLGYSSDTKLPLELFAQYPQLIQTDSSSLDQDEVWKALLTVLEKAFQIFSLSKINEGLVLSQDIQQRLRTCLEALKEVEAKAPNASDKLNERLRNTLDTYLEGKIENEERILREICLYADKVDITEEMIRLKAHLNTMHNSVLSKQSISGKQLEFLLQEMGREINTMGAKSPDLQVIQLTLSMKSEIEKLKEQTQNIE